MELEGGEGSNKLVGESFRPDQGEDFEEIVVAEDSDSGPAPSGGIGRCLSGREVEDVEELVLREDFAVEVGDAKTIVEVPSSPHVYTNIMELTVV